MKLAALLLAVVVACAPPNVAVAPETPPPDVLAAREPTPIPTPEPTPEPTPVPTAVPPAPAPPPVVRTAIPPVRTAPPAPQPAPTPVPVGCPDTWFCYPRLGVAGGIVPYSDCSGKTDIGLGIRSLVCVSPFWLAGHAYTQFGAITGWRAGDVVYASGRRFTITGAYTQNSCEPPAAVAPLSLQTSLSNTACGPVLVVQGQ